MYIFICIYIYVRTWSIYLPIYPSIQGHIAYIIPLSSGFAAELTAKPTLQDVFFDCGELGEFEDGKQWEFFWDAIFCYL